MNLKTKALFSAWSRRAAQEVMLSGTGTRELAGLFCTDISAALVQKGSRASRLASQKCLLALVRLPATEL